MKPRMGESSIYRKKESARILPKPRTAATSQALNAIAAVRDEAVPHLVNPEVLGAGMRRKAAPAR